MRISSSVVCAPDAASGDASAEVDLSHVTRKYIGETEKNLGALFGCAERGGAVLLFDEADALLGRRSEVKDAHDRYANLEVALLLQRLEPHDGIAIVATNRRDADDSDAS